MITLLSTIIAKYNERILKMTKKTVLIVDNSLHVLVMMKNRLKDFGLHIEIARTGVIALEKLSSQSICPDLIIVDSDLSDMTYSVFIKSIKAIPEISLIPILIFKSDNIANTLYENGVNGWLNKSIEGIQLVNIIEQMLLLHPYQE